MKAWLEWVVNQAAIAAYTTANAVLEQVVVSLEPVKDEDIRELTEDEYRKPV